MRSEFVEKRMDARELTLPWRGRVKKSKKPVDAGQKAGHDAVNRPFPA